MHQRLHQLNRPRYELGAESCPTTGRGKQEEVEINLATYQVQIRIPTIDAGPWSYSGTKKNYHQITFTIQWGDPGKDVLKQPNA